MRSALPLSRTQSVHVELNMLLSRSFSRCSLTLQTIDAKPGCLLEHWSGPFQRLAVRSQRKPPAPCYCVLECTRIYLTSHASPIRQDSSCSIAVAARLWQRQRTAFRTFGRMFARYWVSDEHANSLFYTTTGKLEEVWVHQRPGWWRLMDVSGQYRHAEFPP